MAVVVGNSHLAAAAADQMVLMDTSPWSLPVLET